MKNLITLKTAGWALAGLLLLSPSIIAAPGSLGKVRQAYLENAYFDRISEYFSGQENTGGWTVMRSDPDNRVGRYFYVSVDLPQPLEKGSRFVLHLFPDGSKEQETYQFELAEVSEGNRFLLGITQDTWQDPDKVPVAFQIILEDSQGTTKASYPSFLWEIGG